MHFAALRPPDTRRVHTHSLTKDAMILPETMDVQDGRMVHGDVDTHPWRPEGKHHGGCRGAVGPLFPGSCRACSRRERRTGRGMTAYTRNPTTVRMANAALRAGCSRPPGQLAAGFLLP